MVGHQILAGLLIFTQHANSSIGPAQNCVQKTKSWPSSLFQDIDNRQAAANAAFRKAATSCSLLAVGPAGDTAELKIRSRVGAKYVRCVRRQPEQNRRIRTYILTHQYLRV